MSPDEDQNERQYQEHLAYFSREAEIVVDGTRYAFSEDDLRELANSSRYYMLAGGALNSSVYSAAIYLAKRKFRPALQRDQIIALCAATLRKTVDDVERSLEWTANYMAMHDGTDVEGNHPYPRSEP